ncbi:MAG: hypothetical protein KA004_11215 [Verrucomicrobiales bacterium]|nr:hypothetical protein [Verrucomicrobiales bacterium]
MTLPRFTHPLPRSIHFTGICGRLVGGLALALKEAGVHVAGSDPVQFPPMPGMLEAAGIRVSTAWSPENLSSNIDAVVTGGQCADDNPELADALRRGIPIWNAAAFLEAHLLRQTRNLVVAGTKGKTTTTAMLAWILCRAGKTPVHLIGGQMRSADWPLLRLRGGPLAVLEGDEFPCSPDDPLPKLWRYHPELLVVTNVSHDHPDIYPTESSYAEVFDHACRQLPENGRLIVNAEDVGALALLPPANCSVATAGFSRLSTHRITAFTDRNSGCRFRLNGVPFSLPLHGRMNAINAALAACAAESAGVCLADSARFLTDFPGVAGRQEVLAVLGRSIVYGDETSHPVALGPLVRSLRSRHPGRRIVVLMVPCHTGGRSGLCQRYLPEALSGASVVLAFPAFDPKIPAAGPFDNDRLRRDLRRRGVIARIPASLPEALSQISGLCKDGDIFLLALTPGFPTAREQILRAISELVRR